MTAFAFDLPFGGGGGRNGGITTGLGVAGILAFAFAAGAPGGPGPRSSLLATGADSSGSAALSKNGNNLRIPNPGRGGASGGGRLPGPPDTASSPAVPQSVVSSPNAAAEGVAISALIEYHVG